MLGGSGSILLPSMKIRIQEFIMREFRMRECANYLSLKRRGLTNRKIGVAEIRYEIPRKCTGVDTVDELNKRDRFANIIRESIQLII